MKNKKILVTLVICILFSILFSEDTDKLDKYYQTGSPKEWTQNKVDNYYQYLKLKRAADLERPDRRTGTMAGNSIRTLVFDYGSIGAPSREPSVEWPIYSGHGYAYEFGPLVGVEVPVDTNGIFLPYVEKDGESVVDESSPAYDTTYYIISDGLLDGGGGTSTAEKDPNNDPWGWEPVEGYGNEENDDKLPLYSDETTWPLDWDGSWPGTYKANAATADEAIYYVMDDRFNQEFPFYPYNGDKDYGGMGLRVEVRGYQWANVLASDAIFFVYEITNMTDNDYEKVVFGMFGDPHIGGSNDYSDDYAYFDTDLNMVYGYDGDDHGEWGGSTGWFGYTFLESPGNAYDGIDNDGDGMIDESMFNDIDDDGDWDPETDDVGVDGIGPDDNGYEGPDEGEGDGVPTAGDRFDPTMPGEPNYESTDLDEADQIGLTSFNAYQFGSDAIKNDKSIWRRLRPKTLVGEENAFTDIDQNSDNIFLYGSGYFPLKAGDTQRFSVALLMGENQKDLYNTAQVVQNIYDSGYQFATPPDKPTVTAVAGDGKVTLYWDDVAEDSNDPVYGKDFQGYSIYRSTDAGFNECYTITDNNGVATFWEPIARFDLDDGITGESHVGVSGIHFDLGDDTGLQHEYTDTTVTNGVKYYYAVCSYDIGDTTGSMDVCPSECTKTINEDSDTGELTYDVNTIGVIPQAPSLGVTEASLTEEGLVHTGPGTGTVEVKFLDNTAIRDGIDYVISFEEITESPADTVLNVTEQTIYEITVTPEDDEWMQLPKIHITEVAVNLNGSELDTSKYALNEVLGKIKFDSEYIGETITLQYKYMPVYQNSHLDGGDGNASFDGVRILVDDDNIEIKEDYTGWTTGESNMGFLVEQWYNEAELYPHSYKIVWDEAYLEETTSYNHYAPFRVFDITYAYMDSVFEAPFLIVGAVNKTFDFKKSSIGILKGEEQTIENTTWKISFQYPAADVDTLLPEDGDVFTLTVGKPFSAFDSYTFSTVSAKYDPESIEDPLGDIAVVPNPYCAQAEWEEKVEHTGYGRGERKIEFIHLPPECTIRIFTINGELVKKIKHSSTMWDGAESYNLVNNDNQDIAFGIYLWHVDAKASGLGTKTGKFAVIK